MTTNARGLDPLSRLALASAALAQCGQTLSMAGTPAQAREALRKVADSLSSDPRLEGVAQAAELAEQCRKAIAATAESDLVGACRQVATSVARQSANLAKEVQGLSRRGPGAAPAAAARPAAPAPAPAEPTAPEPEPELEPQPEPGIAAGGAARPAQRFTLLDSGAILDTKHEIIWANRTTPAMSHEEAVRTATAFRLGGYGDWSLPTAEELLVLLHEGGLEVLQATRTLTGQEALWTTSRRWRWLRWRAEAVAVLPGSFDTQWRPVTDATARALYVRRAAR